MIDQPPLNEAELVLASLTNEELADAARYMAHMLERWQVSRRDVEYEAHDPFTDLGYHGTEGPVHAIVALDLAILRERAIRGGAEPWDARQTADGHPARSTLLFYRERLEWNPDEGMKPRVAAAGMLERVCPGCGEAKPLTVAFWEWLGTTLALHCRVCRQGTPAQRHEAKTRLRDALVDAEDAAAIAPATWTEPLDVDEPAEAFPL